LFLILPTVVCDGICRKNSSSESFPGPEYHHVADLFTDEDLPARKYKAAVSGANFWSEACVYVLRMYHVSTVWGKKKVTWHVWQLICFYFFLQRRILLQGFDRKFASRKSSLSTQSNTNIYTADMHRCPERNSKPRSLC
jgi:hypothetical protein